MVSVRHSYILTAVTLFCVGLCKDLSFSCDTFNKRYNLELNCTRVNSTDVLTALDEKFSNLEDNETELLTTIEKLQNRTSELESQLNTTTDNYHQLQNATEDWASRSITVGTPEEVIVHTERNDSLTVNCSVTIPINCSDISFSLMKDGGKTDMGWNATNVTAVEDQMCTTVFSMQAPVPLNQSGEYMCMMHTAASSHGPSDLSWTFPVVVHEPLTVKVNATNVQAIENEPVNISCTVAGNPIPETVIWKWKETKVGEYIEVPSDGNNPQSSETDKEFSRVFTLTIMKPQVNMTGYQYNCFAYDRINRASFSSDGTAELSVSKKKCAGVKVYVKQAPNPVEVGTIVTLNCYAAATRDIVGLTWRYSNESQMISNDGNIDIPQPLLDVKNTSIVLTLRDENVVRMNVTCKAELMAENDRREPCLAVYEVNITNSSATTTPPPITTAPTTPQTDFAELHMSQQPKSVKVGGDVIIVCNATSVTVKNFNLSWTDEEGSGLPDNVKGDPVSTSNGSIINATLTVTGLKADLKKVVCKVEADGKQQNKTHNIEVKTEPPTEVKTEPPTGSPVGVLAIAVAVVVLVVLCGVVYLVYLKRHMLRDWLMDKDVVKVIKKQKRGKGYKYSKLPRDISSSMKHLE